MRLFFGGGGVGGDGVAAMAAAALLFWFCRCRLCCYFAGDNVTVFFVFRVKGDRFVCVCELNGRVRFGSASINPPPWRRMVRAYGFLFCLPYRFPTLVTRGAWRGRVAVKTALDKWESKFESTPKGEQARGGGPWLRYVWVCRAEYGRSESAGETKALTPTTILP